MDYFKTFAQKKCDKVKSEIFIKAKKMLADLKKGRSEKAGLLKKEGI